MSSVIMQKPKLSIIIPVYYSASIFPELYKRLVEALGTFIQPFEIIAVVDGCDDDSFEVISAISKKDGRIKGIEFSRNFGHQAAISAGLKYASGEMAAIIDDDLEDPPHVLTSLIAKAQEGYDVVFGIRRARNRSLIYRLFFRLYYRLFSLLSDYQIPNDAGDFCVMSRRVIDVLNAMPERNRYLRGLRAWSGFRQTGIEYDRSSRYAHTSGYSLRKYFALAEDAIFSFSYKPLKLIFHTGFIIALLSFGYGVRLIVMKLLGRVSNVPGWASLLTFVLFLSGIQLLSIGIIGEYVARIYDEVKRRPEYIIKNSIGVEFGE